MNKLSTCNNVSLILPHMGHLIIVYSINVKYCDVNLFVMCWIVRVGLRGHL